MSNRDLPMMPWYPDQFASATSQWTYAERSAYRALLDVQWAVGVLDPDPQRLADSIRLPLDDFLKVWPMVCKKFATIEGGIQNIRLEEHRLKAFALKQSRRAGAELTNAQRSGERRAERTAKRTAERSANRAAERRAERHASDTPLSPTISVEEHPQPPQGGGPGLTANGGKRPRAERDRSLGAWRNVTDLIDHVAQTPNLTWQYVIAQCTDPNAAKAADGVGFRLIADRDKFTTADLQARFRETYERLADAPAPAPAPEPVTADRPRGTYEQEFERRFGVKPVSIAAKGHQ